MVFDRPIYVISSLESENSDKSIDALSDKGNQLPPFLVGHLAEHHYWSLDVNYAEQCSLPRSPAIEKLVPTTSSTNISSPAQEPNSEYAISEVDSELVH